MSERRLIAMRHATASSGASLPSDHERPLAARGVEQAISVALGLKARGWVPERALISDSARTTETWWCMTSVLGTPPATALPSLYGGGVEALIAALQRLDADVGTVIAVGHNPGWSDAIGWLTGTQVRLAPGDAALLIGSGKRWADALGVGSLAVSGVVHPTG